ncbi:thermonuclease family protein [Tateyamaria pelophila]|uniref:thermonuclease family protein n=1 Tax=Tateyamaria pelophila TaxID=328415 RepID=UPI0029587D77|nr:thermonuclease family protein [Tateyamaria pelophila]
MLRICFVFVLSFFPIWASAEVTGKVRVIDADRIDVAGTRVRLHAIDAPEMDQTCDTKDGVSFACGQWATAQVRARFEGKVADCTPRDVDKYGRIVAQCRVDGLDMGEVIVSEGWAFAFRRYGMEYDLTEKAAFVAARGPARCASAIAGTVSRRAGQGTHEC